jgi:hypothetical protein
MFYIIMSQGTVILLFVLLLRMSSTAVKGIRNILEMLMVNSEAKNYSCEHAKKLQQQKDIRRDEIVSLYSSYYRVSMTVKRINEVFGRINRTYFLSSGEGFFKRRTIKSNCECKLVYTVAQKIRI